MTSPQYDVHVQFLQDILLRYMCSQTVPTENRIEMKTKKKKFVLVCFISTLVTSWTAITPQPLRGINNIAETVIFFTGNE